MSTIKKTIWKILPFVLLIALFVCTQIFYSSYERLDTFQNDKDTTGIPDNRLYAEVNIDSLTLLISKIPERNIFQIDSTNGNYFSIKLNQNQNISEKEWHRIFFNGVPQDSTFLILHFDVSSQGDKKFAKVPTEILFSIVQSAELE